MTSYQNGSAHAWAGEHDALGTTYTRPDVLGGGGRPFDTLRPATGSLIHSALLPPDPLASTTSEAQHVSRLLSTQLSDPISPGKPNHVNMRPASHVLLRSNSGLDATSVSSASSARPTLSSGYDAASRVPSGTLRRSAFRTTEHYTANGPMGGPAAPGSVGGAAPVAASSTLRYEDPARPLASQTLRVPASSLAPGSTLNGTSSLLDRGAAYVSESARAGRVPTSTQLLYAQSYRPPHDSTRTQLQFNDDGGGHATNGHDDGHGHEGLNGHDAEPFSRTASTGSNPYASRPPPSALRPPMSQAPAAAAASSSLSAGMPGAGADNVWRNSRLSERIEERLQRARDPAAVLAPTAASGMPLASSTSRSGRVPPPTADGRREQRSASDRVGEVMGSNLRLHDDLAERDAYIQKLNEGCTLLEERIRVLREERAQCEAATRAAEDRLEEAQRQAEMEKNVLIEKRDALQHELEAMALDLRTRDAELDKLRAKTKEHEDYARRSAGEAQQARDDIGRYITDRDHWAREATQLAKQLEEARQQSLAQAAESDAAIKSVRMEMHELQAKLSAAEVEKQVAIASKVDLIEDVNRLNRRLAERDAQVAKLTRLLEQREQTIAELGPVAKESARLSRLAKTGYK
eukprot:m.34045 g.34045  ORF g.34045 m.34045 type:complete len:634 (+) comp9506_c1_seq1:86-1987(+)